MNHVKEVNPESPGTEEREMDTSNRLKGNEDRYGYTDDVYT